MLFDERMPAQIFRKVENVVQHLHPYLLQDVLGKIGETLNCTIDDIMEFVTEEEDEK